MSELINREDAINAVEMFFKDAFIEDADVHCADLEWEINRIPTASPWHRVEDGLPESGTHVLACCEVRGIYGYKSHYVCDAFHTDNKSIPCSYNDDIDSEYDEETDEYYFPVGWWEVIKNWDDYSCVAINDFVTHWMPLPEPPKEDA